MSKTKIRIDSVPEPVQAVVLQAKSDLVKRLSLDPEIVSVTKLERLERPETAEGDPAFDGFGKGTPPDYRIFFLAKGVQYVYETRRGRSPRLTEERFVV